MSLYEGIKDVAKVVQKADNIELYQQLLDLGQQALDMQDEIRQLKQENFELKKTKELENRIIRHRRTYVTLKDDKNEIEYCSVCWDKDKKLVQAMNVDERQRYCVVCKNQFWKMEK